MSALLFLRNNLHILGFQQVTDSFLEFNIRINVLFILRFSGFYTIFCFEKRLVDFSTRLRFVTYPLKLDLLFPSLLSIIFFLFPPFIQKCKLILSEP